jgi:hypothetical protein
MVEASTEISEKFDQRVRERERENKGDREYVSGNGPECVRKGWRECEEVAERLREKG